MRLQWLQSDAAPQADSLQKSTLICATWPLPEPKGLRGMSKQKKHSKQFGEQKTAAGTGKRGRKRKGICLEDRPILEANRAGIDIGAREILVAVPPDRDQHPVRIFSTFTADLERMAQWLVSYGITTALEFLHFPSKMF